MQPFVDLELELGNRVKARYESEDGGAVRVEMVDPLHLDELRARLSWSPEVETYETWGPHDPTELGLRCGTSWDDLHTLAAPNPLFRRLRPTLERLSSALVEGRHDELESEDGVKPGTVRKYLDRLKRRKAGRPVSPPPEAYQAAGCGDGRASVLALPEEDGWKVLFNVWTDKGKQALAFALEVREAPGGELECRLVELTED